MVSPSVRLRFFGGLFLCIRGPLFASVVIFHGTTNDAEEVTGMVHIGVLANGAMSFLLLMSKVVYVVTSLLIDSASGPQNV